MHVYFIDHMILCRVVFYFLEMVKYKNMNPFLKHFYLYKETNI